MGTIWGGGGGRNNLEPSTRICKRSKAKKTSLQTTCVLDTESSVRCRSRPVESHLISLLNPTPTIFSWRCRATPTIAQSLEARISGHYRATAAVFARVREGGQRTEKGANGTVRTAAAAAPAHFTVRE